MRGVRKSLMKTDAVSDELLMSQFAKGQAENLAVLLRRHATPLLTFITRMVGNRHRGEEVFQEVFVAVWRKRDSYSFPRPFKAWLYAIALNKSRALTAPETAHLGQPDVGRSASERQNDTIGHSHVQRNGRHCDPGAWQPNGAAAGGRPVANLGRFALRADRSDRRLH